KETCRRFGGLLQIDCVAKGEEARGKHVVMAEVVGDLILGRRAAKGSDYVGNLRSNTLRQKEDWDDDAEYCQNKCDRRAKIGFCDSRLKPSIRALGHNSDDDCSDDSGKKWFDDESDDDDDSDRQEKKGDLSPSQRLVGWLHGPSRNKVPQGYSIEEQW